jgi:hypothetical protein
MIIVMVNAQRWALVLEVVLSSSFYVRQKDQVQFLFS